jgi:hypothetical protein
VIRLLFALLDTWIAARREQKWRERAEEAIVLELEKSWMRGEDPAGVHMNYLDMTRMFGASKLSASMIVFESDFGVTQIASAPVQRNKFEVVVR